MSASADMVALFRAELELCKVGPDQVLAVLSEGTMRADYAQAFLVAAQELGATAFQINLPSAPAFRTDRLTGNVGKTGLAGNEPGDRCAQGGRYSDRSCGLAVLTRTERADGRRRAGLARGRANKRPQANVSGSDAPSPRRVRRQPPCQRQGAEVHLTARNQHTIRTFSVPRHHGIRIYRPARAMGSIGRPASCSPRATTRISKALLY